MIKHFVSAIFFFAIICFGVISIPTAYSYRLIDNDTFQSYTPFTGGNTTQGANWIVNETGGKWNCTAATYPSCEQAVGGGLGTAGYFISQEVSNKFLSLYSLGGTCGGSPAYYRLGLSWFNIPSTTYVSWAQNQTYVVKYKYRMFSADSIGSCTAGNRYVFQARNFLQTGVQVMGANTQLAFSQGGQNNCTADSCAQKLKGYYNTSDLTSNPFRPLGATCDVSDGLWHDITAIYNVTATTNVLTSWVLKVDGIVCEAETPNFAWLGRFFGNGSSFQMQGGYMVNIDNLAIYESNASENFEGAELPSTQCEDSIDNDGDGFIDYPDDPSCTSSTDDTESPFSTTQCNNGIDDDLDGLTDLADPSCLSLAGSTEWPKQGTTQNYTQCFIDDKCVIADAFPFNDNISLHGWWGTFSQPAITNVYGSNRLSFADAGSYVAYLNNTNPDIYSEAIAEFDMTPEISSSSETARESFYVVMQDESDKYAVKLRIDLKPTASYPYMNITINNLLNNGSVQQLWTVNPTDYGIKSTIKFKLFIDQQLKSYQMTFTVDGTKYEFVEDRPFYDVMSNNIVRFGVESINLSDSDWRVYYDNIILYGDVIGRGQTVCDQYDLPYYLKESFNGYPVDCGWSTSNDQRYFIGQFSIDPTTSRYNIQKTMSDIKEAGTRYSTIKWDMDVTNITGAGSFTLRLYDTDNVNFFSTYILDAASLLFYNQYGSSQTATNVTLGSWVNYKLIIDSQDDSFDLYVNGSQVVNNGGFADQFYNLHDYKTIKLDISYFGIAIDNLMVYSSDSTGNTLLPSEISPIFVDNGTTWCGLFTKTESVCTTDADCATGDCLPNHKCNHFDMTYCDENGYQRGNKCLAGAMASCFFENTTNIIFDNFFYVIILVLLIMGLVYLSILFRRRN